MFAPGEAHHNQITALLRGRATELIRQKVVPFWAAYRFPITVALALRAGLSLWLALVWIVIEPFLTFTNLALKETYGLLVPRSTLFGRALVDVWLRWDAVHYMNIARAGYASLGPGETNFPPLYPLLTRLITPLAFGVDTIAGLMVSTAVAVSVFILLFELVLRVFKDVRLARATILALGIYPTAFFLFAPFTDGLFLWLTLAMFLSVEREKWLMAGVLASLASLTRSQGAILAIPLLVAAFQKGVWRSSKRVEAAACLLLAPTGYVSFLLWRGMNGRPNIIESYQSYSIVRFVNPLKGYLNALQVAYHTGELLAWTEVLSVTLFAAVLVWMVFQPRYRGQASWIAYGLLMLAIFLSKNNLAATPIQSSNRYVLAVFPAFIALADWTSNARALIRKSVVFASLVLLVIASALFALWIFVG